MRISKIRNIIKKKAKKEDFEHHIIPMRNYSMMLAKKYKADKKVVELSAWLHDIGRLSLGGKDHHTKGAKEAEKLLKKLNYPQKTIEHVKECILTHRTSTRLKPKTIEAKIIATADVMSHFDNIPALFYFALCLNKMSIEVARKWVCDKIKKDWKKLLLPEERKLTKEKYEAIIKVLG